MSPLRKRKTALFLLLDLSDLRNPRPYFYIDSELLFFSFLRCRILRPVRLRMRVRNPCLRLRTRRLLRSRFGRGPQRIWKPRPNAGCEVTEDRGTRSATTPPTVSTGEAASGVLPGRRARVFVAERKTGREDARDGRRVGKDVNVLGEVFVSLCCRGSKVWWLGGLEGRFTSLRVTYVWERERTTTP